MKTFRVNIICPVTGKNLVGFAQKYSDISHLVKTIKGVFEIISDEIVFFNNFTLTKKLKLS